MGIPYINEGKKRPTLMEDLPEHLHVFSLVPSETVVGKK